jgi:hypothetical protein
MTNPPTLLLETSLWKKCKRSPWEKRVKASLTSDGHMLINSTTITTIDVTQYLFVSLNMTEFQLQPKRWTEFQLQPKRWTEFQLQPKRWTEFQLQPKRWTEFQLQPKRWTATATKKYRFRCNEMGERENWRRLWKKWNPVGEDINSARFIPATKETETAIKHLHKQWYMNHPHIQYIKEVYESIDGLHVIESPLPPTLLLVENYSPPLLRPVLEALAYLERLDEDITRLHINVFYDPVIGADSVLVTFVDYPSLNIATLLSHFDADTAHKALTHPSLRTTENIRYVRT